MGSKEGNGERKGMEKGGRKGREKEKIGSKEKEGSRSSRTPLPPRGQEVAMKTNSDITINTLMSRIRKVKGRHSSGRVNDLC